MNYLQAGDFGDQDEVNQLDQENVLDIQHSFNSINVPKAYPTLTVNTVWRSSNGHPRTIRALIDTGCNTSLIFSSLLNELTDQNGNSFELNKLQQQTSLLTAGGTLSTQSSINAVFLFDGIYVTRCLYVMDNMATEEQLVLGMDFLTEYNTYIDIPNNIVMIPRMHTQREWGTFCELAPHTDIDIQPYTTSCISLHVIFNGVKLKPNMLGTAQVQL